MPFISTGIYNPITVTNSVLCANNITSATADTSIIINANANTLTNCVVYINSINGTNDITYIGRNALYTNATTTCINNYAIGNTYYYYSDADIYVPIDLPKPKIDYKNIRIKRDYARKALWRSIRLFENLFGINSIQLFINGQSFEIEGRKFNYRISKKSYINLIEHTSNPRSMCIPYTLEVLNKNGLVLFEGCTVFKNTPIIDQIIALILHIRDNEEHVLLNMNLNRLTPNFLTSNNDIEYINRLKGTKYEARS